MPPLPAASFQSRISTFTQLQAQEGRRHQLLGWLRLLVFVLGACGIGYLFYTNRNGAGIAAVVVFYFGFLLLVKKHAQVGYQFRHFSHLVRLNEEELLRLEGQLKNFDPGAEFLDPLHPYTSDLDIFGPHSLFQLLSRATTGIGRNRLADWLQRKASVAEILQRQEAVAELAAALDWRQHFQARGLHHKHQNAQPPAFFEWLRQPDFFAGKAWLKALTFVLPPLTVGALVLWIQAGYSYPFLGLVLGQYLLGYKFTAQREEAYEKSEGMYGLLRSYTSLLEHTEQHAWQSSKLQALRQQLQTEAGTASAQFQRLAHIIEYFSARLNTFIGFIVNTVLMWDFFWMWRVEGWKKQLHANLAPIMEGLAEMEALSSLAAFQFAYPDYAVPELSAEPFTVEAQALGHPLIFAEKRVRNDFALRGAGSTAVITGSNMSGKSTFLRTVGLNLVLACAGAPVCARQLRFPVLQLFTSMRTQDDLSESTSSFYAELKRLKMLLDLTQAGQPVFYLLDEILKGTNSRDRHLGAKALIRQLHQRPAMGLISTHDLELGQLETEMPGSVRNYSFNSYVTNGQLRFDYQLQPGICHSFNASELMRLIGIVLD